MSPQSSRFSSIGEVGRRFEALCAAVLTQIGFIDDTEIENYQNPDAYDFVGRDPESGKKTVGEFKLTLSSRMQVAWMEQAIDRTIRRRDSFPDVQLLLIVTCTLTERWKQRARVKGIELIWDLNELLAKASGATIYGELKSFLASIGVGDLGTLGEAPAADVLAASPSVPALKKGEELCQRLHGIDADRAHATKFEQACVDAIVYLFGSQFGFWDDQNPSEDGFHRRDFVARLRPTHDFWISIAHDFRTRYLVFEFKNYSEQITQNEIYTTEKYLFTAALRSVAIIIARNGADKGAHRAASGALREAGKLILILNLDDLCEMLKGKERVDPEVLLYKRLDTLLTKMLR